MKCLNKHSMSLLIKCVNQNEKKKHIVKQHTIKVLSTLNIFFSYMLSLKYGNKNVIIITNKCV